jgi:hypothetical protein
MSVLARANPPMWHYLPGFDYAISETAGQLRAFLTARDAAGERASRSWTARRTEDGASALNDAVREGLARGIIVSEYSISLALAVLWALPRHVPMPEITVEDDGEIALDWHRDVHSNLTVTVKKSGLLGYSALIGLRPNYGQAPFPGSLPNEVVLNLLRVHPLPPARRRR